MLDPCLLPRLTSEYWAYYAGLFEGEGCMHFVDKNGVTLEIAMTDKDVLEDVQRKLGFGNIYFKKKKQKEHYKDKWVLCIGRKEFVEYVLKGIYPWLKSRRREKADLAFERLKNNLGAPGTWTQCPTCGGPYREQKDSRRKSGKTRYCPACKSRRNREYRLRKKSLNGTKESEALQYLFEEAFAEASL
jgi:intein/homing endonuclease